MQTRAFLRLFIFLLALASGNPEVHAQVSLEYSSFLGGIGTDDAQAVALAPDGCIWVCGYTLSTNFPLVNPLDSTLGGSQDGFVSKLSPDGGTLLFSTYLGGSAEDIAAGIAVDANGDVYICGRTDSSDFPTRNAFQPARNGFWTDDFICKLDANGTNLIYSSYLGGSFFDYAYDVAVDTSGCAYVAGMAWSTDFPTVNPFQPTNTLSSGYNFTLTKVAANGGSLVYSTYLGGSGSGHEYPRVAVTPDGIACFSGTTTSTNFPVVNPYQANHAGPSPSSWDAVISVFSADGSSLTYSTYLGGSEDIDQANDIAIGPDGAITVVGTTQSDNFPVTNAVQDSIRGQPDLFVTQLSPEGDKLQFSTYLGGWDWDYGSAVALGDDGSVIAVGIAVSANYPVYEACQPANAGGYEAAVTRLSPDGTPFVYSTYLGGSGSDYGRAAVIDSNGAAIVVGRTESANFPAVKPFQGNSGGDADAFICRLNLMPLHISGISRTGGAVRVEWAGEGSVLTQRLMRTGSLASPQQWSCIHTCTPGGARCCETTDPSNALFRVDMQRP
ncbi:MAG TPA: SBBP repeat-containing protein [Kiritimatiellia bacterium]|nr:SBBP repeat-containing protein [Kiritimatiellia bacterium]HNS81641.1 SBBP repeat-containing protein [Kiritimatiellia bacterium]HPA78812.1 SBBP repeat-containing protein [Kiritimatiellia bacterium]HQQ04041.1 SBBP repeat-containing protein [Kiritimatiellia bacterium]